MDSCQLSAISRQLTGLRGRLLRWQADKGNRVVQDFRKLAVWRKAHAVTLAVYKATRQFPQEELYGLTRQLRRSCASVPTNIAEGCGRGTDAEFAKFLQIAMGSASNSSHKFCPSFWQFDFDKQYLVYLCSYGQRVFFVDNRLKKPAVSLTRPLLTPWSSI